jgi:hypothetical protein
VVQEWPEFARMFRPICEINGCCHGGSMQFPECGAFGPKTWDDYDAQEDAIKDGQVVADRPPKPYRNEDNVGLIFAKWDRRRKELEAENPTLIYPMSQNPDECGPISEHTGEFARNEA